MTEIQTLRRDGLPADEAARGETEALLARRAAALARRSRWEGLWQDCYDHTLPSRGALNNAPGSGPVTGTGIFDATAADAVEQLAASLLSQLVPPSSAWFGLKPGPEMQADEAAHIAPALERVTSIIRAHVERSNFAVEVHQCFLDLVTGGTASLLVEEAGPGQGSALKFTAIPLYELAVEEGPEGRASITFRDVVMRVSALQDRFPDAVLSPAMRETARRDPAAEVTVTEAVVPAAGGWAWTAMVVEGEAEPVTLASGRFAENPFVTFRWMKAPGEVWGRSPVMKVLPDIRTANKVVELILKNASIAVTGIWQADDDGVLNPATIRLKPGTIIPKAVGSAGLTPLAAPGRFDVSQIVLEDLRARIRKGLLVDHLGQVDSFRMTATEVLERSAESARIMGATYGRLQSELITPLILRVMAILRRRGIIPDIRVDGRLVQIDHRSPLARAQARRDLQGAAGWLETASALGPEALAAVDVPAAMQWLADALGVPGELVRRAAPQPLRADPPMTGSPGETGTETETATDQKDDENAEN